VFCFQPGEEGSAGNRLMIEDGALENPHVDRTFALHLYSGLDVGKIGVRDGAFFASADEYTLIIKGKRRPRRDAAELAIDPIVAGAYFVTMLQTIVSREIAPKDPGGVHRRPVRGGTTFNVIPDEAVLKGTVRCVRCRGAREHARTDAPDRGRARRGAARRDRGRLPLVVSADRQRREPNDVVAPSVGRLLGPENVVEHDIVMWAEDMSFMQEQRPGAYFIVGARGAARQAPFPHHNARFDIDERSLDVGYQMMVGLGLGL
jgi:amidohydrolase